jgi:hypothetical protein
VRTGYTNYPAPVLAQVGVWCRGCTAISCGYYFLVVVVSQPPAQ